MFGECSTSAIIIHSTRIAPGFLNQTGTGITIHDANMTSFHLTFQTTSASVDTGKPAYWHVCPGVGVVQQ